jgi:hypothetical protein
MKVRNAALERSDAEKLGLTRLCHARSTGDNGSGQPPGLPEFFVLAGWASLSGGLGTGLEIQELVPPASRPCRRLPCLVGVFVRSHRRLPQVSLALPKALGSNCGSKIGSRIGGTIMATDTKSAVPDNIAEFNTIVG